jgi:proline iminopeptidase
VEPNLDPDESALVRARTLHGLGAWDWRPLLGRLQVPVLLIHGRENPIPIEASMEYAMRLPQGRLLVLDESGHFPWLERPVLFFVALNAFLDGTWPEGAQVLRP